MCLSKSKNKPKKSNQVKISKWKYSYRKSQMPNLHPLKLKSLKSKDASLCLSLERKLKTIIIIPRTISNNKKTIFLIIRIFKKRKFNRKMNFINS